MYQPLSLFIGLRYAKASKGNSFVSFINFFSTTGILIGVTSLIVVVSVMNGFEDQLKQRILGLVPQVVMTPKANDPIEPQLLERIKQQSTQIHAAVPYLASEGMIQGRVGMNGVMVLGIWPEYSEQVSPVFSHLQAHSGDGLKDKGYGVLISSHTARNLGVEIGDKVRLMVLEGARYTPMGLTPNQRRFIVRGIFELSSAADSGYVLVHGDDLRRLTRKAEPVGVRLYLDDAFAASTVAQQIERSNQFNDFIISDWRQRYGQLFEAVKLEKSMMWLMLGLIICVAVFNVISAMMMVVNSKQGAIAILQTQGMEPRQILRIFIIQGSWLGLLGTLIGAVFGVLLTSQLNQFMSAIGVSLAAVTGYPSGLPVVMQAEQIVAIVIVAMLMSISATLFPAYRASKIKPAGVLRYE